MNKDVGLQRGAATPAPTDDNAVPTAHYIDRKIIRAEFHHYSGGNYFVTICTRDKCRYFGEIANGEMHLSAVGKYAHDELKSLHKHYVYAEVPLFIVMPNHIHAINCIKEPADAPGCVPPIRTALGVIVGGYKQAVTRFARRNNIVFGWQSRFHDHIIRGLKDGNNIAEYIETNIARWDSDCYYM